MKVDLDELVEGVLQGDRTSLGKALTLVESSRSDDREVVESLLAQISLKTGEAHRIGITGVPGAVKAHLLKQWEASLSNPDTKWQFWLSTLLALLAVEAY